MVLVLITLGAALVVGYARGGRLRHLVELRPQRGRLLVTALCLAVVGVLAGWAWPATTTVLWSLTLVTVAWFCWLNRTVHGASLVAAGFAVNAVAGLAGLFTDPPRVLTLLGDRIPVALPWTVERIGAGDVLIAAGLATILAMGMAGAVVPVVADTRDALVVADIPVVANGPDDETLNDADHSKEHHHGQAQSQAQGPQEERREPREAAQQLT